MSTKEDAALAILMLVALVVMLVGSALGVYVSCFILSAISAPAYVYVLYFLSFSFIAVSSFFINVFK